MRDSRLAPWLAALLLPAAVVGAAGMATAATPGASPVPGAIPSAEFDPSQFGGPIDNPYWPMSAGSWWVYRETDPEGTDQTVEVTVTGKTREILGVTATVVHDLVTVEGETVEDTYDWYAQDHAGNIWYLGEDTKEYQNGEVVSTEGSWEGGVDGAQPGIVVQADPVVGMLYRQEYLEGHAEDVAQVLSLDERAEVPFGAFDRVLMTRDFTTLNTDVEYKFYAKGVGQVLAIGVSGGSSREELVDYVPGS